MLYRNVLPSFIRKIASDKYMYQCEWQYKSIKKQDILISNLSKIPFYVERLLAQFFWLWDYCTFVKKLLLDDITSAWYKYSRNVASLKYFTIHNWIHSLDFDLKEWWYTGQTLQSISYLGLSFSEEHTVYPEIFAII